MGRLTDTYSTRKDTDWRDLLARHGWPDLSMGRTPLMNNSPQADYEWDG